MKRVQIARTIGATAALALGIFLFTGAEEAPKTDAAKPSGPTAAQQFKNIKVLKDLPADQLMPTMHEFAVAIGGNCASCHEGGDFASDAKKMKLVTRDMILMTRKLNDTEPVVKKSVSCFMCHHGRPEPFETAEQQKAFEEKQKAKASGSDKASDSK
jgi:hypothetical protein